MLRFRPVILQSYHSLRKINSVIFLARLIKLKEISTKESYTNYIINFFFHNKLFSNGKKRIHARKEFQFAPVDRRLLLRNRIGNNYRGIGERKGIRKEHGSLRLGGTAAIVAPSLSRWTTGV